MNGTENDSLCVFQKMVTLCLRIFHIIHSPTFLPRMHFQYKELGEISLTICQLAVNRKFSLCKASRITILYGDDRLLDSLALENI